MKSEAKSTRNFGILGNGFQKVDLIPRFGGSSSQTMIFNGSMSGILYGYEKAEFEA